MREKGESQISQELLNLARAGDREALAALYDCTHQEVYRTAHALLRDENLVLDVQQETYLHAFSHLDQLRDAGSFLPWLRKIAVNEARSQLRKRTPVLFSELNLDEAEAVPEPTLRSEDPDADPALHLEQKENARLVREILDELSDGQRMLVAMYYYENVPIKQIAETLQISPGTVKSQLARSRRKVEERVCKLEQEGVKLYGLGPIPFLVALLRNETPVTEAGKLAIPSVAIHVGRTFFETALGRVVLALLAIGVMVGGAAGWKRHQERQNIGNYQPTDTDSSEDLIHTTEPLTTTEPVETTEPSGTEDPFLTLPETLDDTDTMDGQNRRNKLFEKPLSEIETEEVSRQSNILQDIEIEEQISDMPIADLSEYFVRCQRFENTETMSSIRSARYELLAKETESATIEWAYWILTSENGTEYWLLGFTDHPFEALAVFRNGPEGEMLYGQIR